MNRSTAGNRVAQWTTPLDPRPDHLDRRITISTPLRKAGAYLVTATMKDGNTSRIVLWLNDTAIVRKPLNDKSLYYIADAVTGAPVEKANVEFFGWRQERVPNTKRDYRVITRNFAEFSDEDGLVLCDPKQMDRNFQWLAIAGPTAVDWLTWASAASGTGITRGRSISRRRSSRSPTGRFIARPRR